MTDCDKAKIVGYIPQTQEQIEAINTLKEKEIELIAYLSALLHQQFGAHGPDARWLAIGKTHIQQGFMCAVRAVARPMGD